MDAWKSWCRVSLKASWMAKPLWMKVGELRFRKKNIILHLGKDRVRCLQCKVFVRSQCRDGVLESTCKILWAVIFWIMKVKGPQYCKVSTLGMTCPVAPETVYLHQPQQPPSAGHIDWFCLLCCQKYSRLIKKCATIAMTPLTLKGDIMMLPGSSFSCWYSRLPNTCRDWYGVDARVFCKLSVVFLPNDQLNLKNLLQSIAFTVFPVATAATWLTALILSDMMRLLIGRDGGAGGRLWQDLIH